MRCPYCDSNDFQLATSTERIPHPAYDRMQCNTCSDYFAGHKNGKGFPLSDRTNVNSDVVSRILDE